VQVSMNPMVKFFLQQHLVNQHEPYADIMTLGTIEEVGTVAKICSNEAVTRYCTFPPLWRSYPELPKGCSIVALVDRGCHVHVIAIYTIKQMQQIELLPGIRSIQWRVLEMSQALEEELLKEVNIEQGVIFSPMETMWVQSAQL
jgi:hypothetical protein